VSASDTGRGTKPTFRSLLVTGARGFIGRHLARSAAAGGWWVAGLGHGGFPDAAEWGLSRWLNADVTGANLDLVARGAELDALVHLAGGSSVAASLEAPLEDFERTVTTSARLLEWVRTAAPRTRVVLVSSAAVYGSGHTGLIPETAPQSPSSPYGFHKSIMEQLGASYRGSYGLDVEVVRLFSVYGPGLAKQLIWDLSRRLEAGASRLELAGTGDEARDFLHVSDAVRLLVLTASSGQSTDWVMNGGTGTATRVREIAARVAEAFGRAHVELLFTGERRAGDPVQLVADVARARARGFVPAVTLEAGLADTLASYGAAPR